MLMPSPLCVLTFCLFMVMWYQISTLVRRFRSTGEILEYSGFCPVNVNGLVTRVNGLACPQASAKSGKEHLSDDHDLQDIVAGSQVPLRGRRRHRGCRQQESEDFTLPEDARVEEVSVPHGKLLTTHLRDLPLWDLMNKHRCRLLRRIFFTAEAMNLKSDTTSWTVISASAPRRSVSIPESK